MAIRLRAALPYVLAAISMAVVRMASPARRRTEDSLRESEARYRSLMESGPDALVIVDESGCIRLVNERTEAFFGYRRDELLGQPVEILVPDALRERHVEHRRAYQAHPRPRHACSGLQLFGQRKDGSRFPVDITLSPTRLRNGLLITAAVRDLSGIRRLEDERRSAEEASRAKSLFLANISHELRSPLNTILGFARLMARSSELPDSIRDDLQLVLKSSEHLHELIEDVLDLSRLDIGSVALDEADFDLDLLLRELKELFARTAADKGLLLAFSPGSDVPRHIRCDPAKLRKILINLLDNALRFTDRGQVAVNIESETTEDGPVWLEFRIADTGRGIPPGELPDLFEPFTRPRAGRDSQTGSGLGLALSRRLAQVMGGHLDIDSAPGRGTTARFGIPVEVAAGLAVGAGGVQSRVIGLAPGQPRYRILAVDDYPEARRLLVRLLAPLGFELREAADGEQAVAMWRQWQPNLILMDIRMPILDGYEATRRIRAMQPGPRPVIIALTASSSEKKRNELLAAGCDDFLHKPFHESQLHALIEKRLGVRFVYEKRSQPVAAPPDPDPAAVAALPADLRAALEDGLRGLDTEAVDRAIDAIRERDNGLGEALGALAQDFQYERIQKLIERRPL